MKVEFELDDDLAEQVVIQYLKNSLDLMEKFRKHSEEEMIASIKDVIEYYGG